MSLHQTLRFSDPKTFAARSIEAHEIALSDDAHGGQWHLRDYQKQAIDQ